jgi:hypothetical protein
MVELVPIVIPQIDWSKLLGIANQVLGASISSSFDAAKIPTGPRAFVVSMNDLNLTTPALDIDVAALRHLSYTFLAVVLEGTYLAIVEEASLLVFTSSVTTRPGIRVVIVSGNLLDWKEAVACCSGSSNPDVKEFGVKAQKFFESVGLGDIWKHYFRITQPDRTLKLVHHK